MPKLYTKSGDAGFTSLYDGNRIPKYTIFFKCLGEIDELSSNIGMLCAFLTDKEIRDDTCKILRNIQVLLIDISSNIAVYNKDKRHVPIIKKDIIDEIERYIDQYDCLCPKLTEFILPGINTIDSQCHICRSITRRVERKLWKLEFSNEKITNNKDKNIELDSYKIEPAILIYINRLSDFFFALSRFYSIDNELKVSDVKLQKLNLDFI